MSKHYEHSSYRESLLTHLFVGELLKLAWQKHDCGLEVAKPEVDNAGYDVIAEFNGVLRHIQLKSSHLASSTSKQKVHVKLAGKPSGCMIWIVFDDEELQLDHFLYFGGKAGESLPDLASFKVAKHSKGNKDGTKLERQNIRVVNKGQFKRLSTIEEVYEMLFCK